MITITFMPRLEAVEGVFDVYFCWNKFAVGYKTIIIRKAIDWQDSGSPVHLLLGLNNDYQPCIVFLILDISPQSIFRRSIRSCEHLV